MYIATKIQWGKMDSAFVCLSLTKGQIPKDYTIYLYDLKKDKEIIVNPYQFLRKYRKKTIGYKESAILKIGDMPVPHYHILNRVSLLDYNLCLCLDLVSTEEYSIDEKK